MVLLTLSSRTIDSKTRKSRLKEGMQKKCFFKMFFFSDLLHGSFEGSSKFNVLNQSLWKIRIILYYDSIKYRYLFTCYSIIKFSIQVFLRFEYITLGFYDYIECIK